MGLGPGQRLWGQLGQRRPRQDNSVDWGRLAWRGERCLAWRRASAFFKQGIQKDRRDEQQINKNRGVYVEMKHGLALAFGGP